MGITDLMFDPRKGFIKKIKSSDTILEIGPFHNPVCTGDHVAYFDILDQDALIQRAVDIGSSDKASSVPFIDFVSRQGDLGIIDRSFDTVVSSHVIEHQLDLVGHLNSVSKILNSDGRYFLFIPDKRYCFDHFNHESTIAEVLDASFNKRAAHSLKSLIEHRAMTTHNNTLAHWKGDHGEEVIDIEKIKGTLEEYRRNEYFDVHAWYFTPDSFASILNMLLELEMIDLEIEEIQATTKDTLEFFVILKRK